jgi:hypothetical protein
MTPGAGDDPGAAGGTPTLESNAELGENKWKAHGGRSVRTASTRSLRRRATDRERRDGGLSRLSKCPPRSVACGEACVASRSRDETWAWISRPSVERGPDGTCCAGRARGRGSPRAAKGRMGAREPCSVGIEFAVRASRDSHATASGPAVPARDLNQEIAQQVSVADTSTCRRPWRAHGCTVPLGPPFACRASVPLPSPSLSPRGPLT